MSSDGSGLAHNPNGRLRRIRLEDAAALDYVCAPIEETRLRLGFADSAVLIPIDQLEELLVNEEVSEQNPDAFALLRFLRSAL